MKKARTVISGAEFPKWIQLADLLSTKVLKDLIDYLDIDSHQPVQSHVFNRITKENVVNKHLRSSRKIEYRDDKLFDWADEHIVQVLNTKVEGFNFHLVRNDLEVVKYSEGDFFKKHQDYVNFDSNEFRNYTFLICLGACELGGETLIYEGPDTEEHHVIECTGRIPGSGLVFQKTTIHEGRTIEKGNKILLKGNLVCFRNLNTKDYVVVELEKGNTETWIIPVEVLQKKQPNSVYLGFYRFSKQNQPNQHIFTYHDTQLSVLQFSLFYKKLMEPEELATIDKALDYVGFSKDAKLIKKFNKWLNNPDDKMLICGLRDYYELVGYSLQMDNILPFQLITIEADGGEIVAWLGVGVNQFVTCDYFLINVNEPAGWKYKESIHTSEDAVKAIAEHFTENNKLEIKFRSLVPERYWRSRLDISRKEDFTFMKEMRDHLWKHYALTPLSSNINNEVSVADQVPEFIGKLLVGLGDTPDEESTPLFYLWNRKTYYTRESIGTDKQISNDQLVKQIGQHDDHLRKLVEKVSIDSLVDIVKSVDEVVSYMSRSSLSEFFCNETYYLKFDIICRTGFLKVVDS